MRVTVINLVVQGAKDCHSLLKKYLTKEVVDQLKDKKTKLGANLLDVIQSGKEDLTRRTDGVTVVR